MFGFALRARSSRRGTILLGCLVGWALLPVSTAAAGPGYALSSVKSSITLGGEVPHGIAIDQTSQAIYVTELSTDVDAKAPGQIEQFDANGIATANSPFHTGGEDLFAGVAVNPLTHDIYAYQSQLVTPEGTKGVPVMNIFSSTGVLGTSFSPGKSTGPHLAVDSSGRVYFANEEADVVQVYNSSGVLQSTISCTGCSGGAFSEPSSVAIDPAGSLYVVDLAAAGRVLKFVASGGTYVYSSLLQSGVGAAAVAVDPVSGDVLVGDIEGTDYHVAVFDSSGVQFDDFGGGTVGTLSGFGPMAAGQIAINATTRRAYVADSAVNKIWIFDRVASVPVPTVSVQAASPVGQLEATLKGVVNPNGHGLTNCQFKYTTNADFQANGFANAITVPCTGKPPATGSSNVTASVNGLSPATNYVFRLFTTSYGGAVESTSQSFQALPALAPAVTTGSASSITLNKATVAGTVNPRGGPISNCHFDYVKEAAFLKTGFAGAASSICVPKPTSGSTDVAVSAKLNGLESETTYRFRLVAINNSGTGEGSGVAFATAGESCATNPSFCPLTEVIPPLSPPTTPLPRPTVTTPTKKPLVCRRGFKKKKVRGKMRCVKKKKKRRARAA